MRSFSSLVLLALAASSAVATVDDVQLFAEFHQWMDFHQKSYETKDEKHERLQIWLDNDGT